MEKDIKIVILLSIAVVIVTMIIIIILAPGSYEEQCKQKSKMALDNLISLSGGKIAFLKSFNDNALSNEAQKELKYLKNILNQCPSLKLFSQDNLGIDISINR